MSPHPVSPSDTSMGPPMSPPARHTFTSMYQRSCRGGLPR